MLIVDNWTIPPGNTKIVIIIHTLIFKIFAFYTNFKILLKFDILELYLVFFLLEVITFLMF